MTRHPESGGDGEPGAADRCHDRANEDEPIRLRGHHLGCTAGFTGHGYDSRFTEHLSHIAGILSREPDREVIVVEGPDDLCRRCPHLRGDICARDRGAEQRVRVHDREFVEALGLSLPGRTTPREVADRMTRDRETRDRILRACLSCPWTNVCTFFVRGKGL